MHSGIIVKSRQSHLLVIVTYYTLRGVTPVMQKTASSYFCGDENKWFDQVNSQRSHVMLKQHVKMTLLVGYKPSVKCTNMQCSQRD